MRMSACIQRIITTSLLFASVAALPGPAQAQSTALPEAHERPLNRSASAAAPDAWRGALALDGVNDYATTPDHDELDVGNAGGGFTLEAWFDMRAGSSSPVDRQHIITSTGSFDFYAVRYYDWGAGRRYGCIGFAWITASGQSRAVEHCRYPAYALGLHHAAVVYQSVIGQGRFYLDGAAFGNAFDMTTGIQVSNGEACAGHNWDGALDELRISHVARYTGDTYSTPAAPFDCDANTGALWHFDEFEGLTVFHDACGADNVLTGWNGAHTEGVPAYRTHLPRATR